MARRSRGRRRETISSAEVRNIQPGPRQSVLWLHKGMEIMRICLTEVHPENATVVGAVAMIRVRGRDRDLVASNDALTRFRRVAYTDGSRHTGHIFKLSPMNPAEKKAVFAAADFPPGSGISVWEFGVGRRATSACSARPNTLVRSNGSMFRVYSSCSQRGGSINLGHPCVKPIFDS